MKNLQENLKLLKAKSGDTETINELVTSYKGLVSSVARRYFILGGETDDLIQEGMMGLYEAIKTYKLDSTASFKTFAKLLIERKVQTAVKKANRQKNIMLNQFIPINNQGIIERTSNETSFDEDDDNTLGIYVESNLLDPEEDMISREGTAYIEKQIEEKLSDKEKQVLGLFIEGRSYHEISQKLNITKKNVDNSLYSIRKKLHFLKQN